MNFTLKERNELISFMDKRSKFDQVATKFDVEEVQMLNSQNFGQKAW